MYCATHGIPIFPTSAEPYAEIFKVLHNGHQKLGCESLSGLHTRDERVRELGVAPGVRFNGSVLTRDPLPVEQDRIAPPSEPAEGSTSE